MGSFVNWFETLSRMFIVYKERGRWGISEDSDIVNNKSLQSTCSRLNDKLIAAIINGAC